jgi:D-alanyl-D-alanine carboxypeptidase/lipoprotein-anchoring transpeptidase ErfK/SrfK
MNGLDHSFDWVGFRFVMRGFVAIVALGLPLAAGAWYVSGYAVPWVGAPFAATPAPAAAAAPSSTGPDRTIEALSIAEAVPAAGKFIAADLDAMQLYLYEDGVMTATYPIKTKGRIGSPYETPAGFYEVLTKERDHLNRGAGVRMPYSMAFYGNYFIHGWPVHLDGTPVPESYSGGCIRLSTEDAAEVFAFADPGTKVFIYDPRPSPDLRPVALADLPVPDIAAAAYLVADIDTGHVYAERDARVARPIASVTKLMTALVANETIMFDYRIPIPQSELTTPSGTTTPSPAAALTVEDLLYPLLMESNNHVADRLARYYGTNAFVGWMNDQARALGMTSTSYADPSGISRENVSTPEDLYRLAVYLSDKKSFIWKVSRTPEKTIAAADGSSYTFHNFNIFFDLDTFTGGKVGLTAAAKETMVSVFSMPINGADRRIAVIVLGADSFAEDTDALVAWFSRAASGTQAACVNCHTQHAYRQIPL